MKDFPDWFFEKADWQEKTLGEIAEFYSGGTPSNSEENYNGKIPFIRSGEIHFDKTALFISETGLKNSSAKLVSKGNLLYALYGATSGECDISKIDGAINQAILCIIPKEFDSVFLKNLLTYKKSWIVNKFLQGGQGNLSAELIKKLQFKFPPPETQKKIADYFTHLDNAINAQDLKLKSWRDAKKAMLQKIFAQEFYFTTDSGEKYPAWQEKTLGDVAPLQRGFDLPSTKLKNGKYPVIYSNGILNYHDSYKCEGEAVITGRSGTIGKVFYLENCKYWAHNTTLWVTDFKNNYPKFIYYLFQTVPIKNYSAGTGVPTLNRNDLHEHILKIPCVEEQKKIADYFSSLDKIIDAENKMLESLRQMKRGLLQKLFV